MKLTKHFEVREWVDFVRDVGEAADRSAMADHLSAGCPRCQAVIRSLHAVVKLAALEASSEPPAGVIRRAQAIFPPHRSEMGVLARLIYDSFREPLPAGMRAQGRVARHALYEAGNVFVDLQLEHEASSGTVTLVGQVSDRDNPQINTTSLPVVLMARKGLVTSAICNRLGEFEMEFRPARDLRLHVPLRETGGHVDLRMDELSPVPSRRRRQSLRHARPRKRASGRTQH